MYNRAKMRISNAKTKKQKYKMKMEKWIETNAKIIM